MPRPISKTSGTTKSFSISDDKRKPAEVDSSEAFWSGRGIEMFEEAS